jgi:hypothetical protein
VSCASVRQLAASYGPMDPARRFRSPVGRSSTRPRSRHLGLLPLGGPDTALGEASATIRALPVAKTPFAQSNNQSPRRGRRGRSRVARQRSASDLRRCGVPLLGARAASPPSPCPSRPSRNSSKSRGRFEPFAALTRAPGGARRRARRARIPRSARQRGVLELRRGGAATSRRASRARGASESHALPSARLHRPARCPSRPLAQFEQIPRASRSPRGRVSSGSWSRVGSRVPVPARRRRRSRAGP